MVLDSSLHLQLQCVDGDTPVEVVVWESTHNMAQPGPEHTMAYCSYPLKSLLYAITLDERE